MTFVELPVVPIYWHFPRTIKGYKAYLVPPNNHITKK